MINGLTRSLFLARIDARMSTKGCTTRARLTTIVSFAHHGRRPSLRGLSPIVDGGETAVIRPRASVSWTRSRLAGLGLTRLCGGDAPGGRMCITTGAPRAPLTSSSISSGHSGGAPFRFRRQAGLLPLAALPSLLPVSPALLLGLVSDASFRFRFRFRRCPPFLFVCSPRGSVLGGV